MKIRSLIVINALATIALIFLWTAPRAGFVMVAVALMVLPPWGRSYAQRAVISGLVLVGVIAVAFPRAGSLPIDQLSASVFFGGLLAVAMALRLIPNLRAWPMPRVSGIDVVVVVFTAVIAAVPVRTFLASTSEQAISSLFHTGWDNQGHLVPFLNTVMAGSSQWVSADGSDPWNQSYPAVHTHLWSLAQVVVGSQTPDRISLVIPYAVWVALSFAAAMGVLMWVSGDLARRLAGNFDLPHNQVNTAGILSALGVGFFGVFGSVQFLYSAGFTNFVMAVSVVAGASYLTARDPVRLGWFVLPFGAWATAGLWTPLTLGLVPAGLVVAYLLIRIRAWLGIVWLLAVSGVGVMTLLSQANALLGVSSVDSVRGFTETVGAVGVGMTGFNLTLGMAAPIISVFMAIVIWNRSSKVLAALLPIPLLASAALALLFATGADSVETSRLTSYYVLKSLNAGYLLFIPLLIAAAALAVAVLVARLNRLHAALVTISVFVVGVSTFGFIGFNANQLSVNINKAPGISVAQEREQWIQHPYMGIQIANSARAAQTQADFTPVVWQGIGTLENLWVLTLTNVVSNDQSKFYLDLPQTPYTQTTLAQISEYIYANPASRVQLLWRTPEAGAELQQWAAPFPAERITTTEVVIP